MGSDECAEAGYSLSTFYAFAVYNKIVDEKQTVIYPDFGHEGQGTGLNSSEIYTRSSNPDLKCVGGKKIERTIVTFSRGSVFKQLPKQSSMCVKVLVMVQMVIVRPRMWTYIRVSMLKVEMFESVTDLVEPYSGDEDHLDVPAQSGYLVPRKRLRNAFKRK